MSHFFEKRDRWGNGLSLWVIVGCIFITPLCLYSLRGTRIENDIEHWLPAGDPNAVTLNWSMKQFGLDTGDSIYVSWDDSSLQDPRITKLAERLEGKLDEKGVRRDGLPQVARVVTPMSVVARMVENGVERDEALKRLQGVLVGTGAFKVRLTEYGRQRKKEVIRKLVATAKTELGLDLQVLEAVKDFESSEETPDVVVAEDAGSENAAAAADPAVPPPTDQVIVEFDPLPAHDFQEIGRASCRERVCVPV